MAFWNGLRLITGSQELLILLLIGIGIGALLYFVLIRKWTYFLTFEHELTHAIMSLLFLRKVTRFRVTRYEGGVVYHSGGFGGDFGNIMITLAPYYFPTFTVVALLFQPLIPPKFISIYIVFVGFTLIFHHLSTVLEIRDNWHSHTFAEAGSGKQVNSDIGRSGFLFSFIFILTMTLFFNALILWFVKYSYRGVIPLSKDVFNDSVTVIHTLFFKLISLIS